mgnify:CR=1 FL=1
MTLKLVTVPDPRLREQSLPVKTLNKKNIQFIRDLGNTLVKKENPSGVGLSAVQVGTNVRVFFTLLPPVYDFTAFADDLPQPELQVYINPEIVDASKQMTYGPDPDHPALEGCLSIPSLYGPVLRHQTIKLKYKTLDDVEIKKFVHGAGPHEVGASTPNYDLESLHEKTKVFSHFYARVIQHEYDHLDGILFTDYIKKEASELYFDTGDKLTPIPNPKDLILW